MKKLRLLLSALIILLSLLGIHVLQDDEPEVIHYSNEETITFMPLDNLNRAQKAYGVISMNTFPEEGEKRGSISHVKPSGWHLYRFDDIIKDKYLYNRCHLIAWMLSGENANERNLITCTRSANVDGMLPYEVMIKQYILETQNTVYYEVTPIYEGNNLLASSIHLMANSIEDDGLEFDVIIENSQPGITINYETGEAWPTNH